MKRVIFIVATLFMSNLFAIDEEGIKDLLKNIKTDTAHMFYNDDRNNTVILQLATAIDMPVTNISIAPGEYTLISDKQASRYPVVGIDLQGITTRAWWKDLKPYGQQGSLYIIKGDPKNSSGMKYSMQFWNRK